MNAAGFYVCDPDLEAELVTALGEAATEAMIASAGDGAKFAAYAGQPQNAQLTRFEQLVGFMKKPKTKWAPRLVDELDAGSLPTPLKEVLSHV